MKKIIVIIALLNFLGTMVRAQTDLDKNRILYPSPTAAALGKYGEYPVSLYNGLVSINQDICTIESGKLSLGISLSYHSGGNRPSDIPGWVGLGFSLNAGGVITRVVHGIPDDAMGGYYTSRNEIKTLLSPSLQPGPYFVQDYLNRNVDAQSDIYQFNFNGKTGQFVFDLDGNVRLLKNEPYKIEFDYGTVGTFFFESFRITTEDGVIYTFSAKEESSYEPRIGHNFYTSSWYLTKVQNLSGDSIVLNYSQAGNDRRYKLYESEKIVKGTVDFMYPFDEYTNSVSSNHDVVIYLEEIIFNGGKLSFQKSNRNDVAYVPMGVPANSVHEKKLDAITLSDHNNNAIKRWQFNYTEDTGRFKLNKMTLLGHDSVADQVYQFEYNGTLLPSPGPNRYVSNSIDYWGYFNKHANVGGRIPYTYSSEYGKYFGSADRDCDPDGMKAEILERIIFPTGGYSQFEFEINDYGYQGESVAANPMVNYFWDSLDFSYEDGYFDQDPYEMSFTLPGPRLVKISRSIKPGGPNHAWLPGSNSETIDVVLEAGTYNLGTIFSANTLTNEANSDIHFARGAVVWRNEVPTRAKNGPGLRIKTITNFDGQKATKKEYQYREEDSTISTGVLSVFPAHYTTLHHYFSNATGILLSSDPINGQPSDPPIGYRKVTEVFPDSSKIEHHFTNYMDYPDLDSWFHNGYTDPKLGPLNSSSYMRGLEVYTATYAKNRTLLKDVRNEYLTLPGTTHNVPALNLMITFNQETLGDVNHVNGVVSSYYMIPIRFVYKSSEEERNFDKDGLHPINKKVRYFYSNPNHLQITGTETTGSSGLKTYQSVSYPTDYENGVSFIDNLKANHIWNLPVEIVQYKGSEQSAKITAGKINIYNEDGKGLKKEEWLLVNTDPVPLGSFKFSNQNAGNLPVNGTPTSFLKDTKYELRVSYKYDNKGNIIELNPAEGVPTSYLWSYQKKYPIAELKNTSYTAIENLLGSSVIETFSNSYPDKTSVDNFLNVLKQNLTGAGISSYSYKTLVGLQSATDAKGMTSYYEYDALGRLRAVKDHSQNVINTYDYHFKP
jgi:YD repeat-containing protein